MNRKEILEAAQKCVCGDRLAEELDRETSEKGSREKLQMFGSEDSRYLNAVEDRARKLGLKVARNTEAPVYLDGPVVVDTETIDGFPIIPFKSYDLDGVESNRASCTSEAVRTILDKLLLDRPHVCIIGRGHAVKGLAAGLLEDDATVTVCHSRTRWLAEIAGIADVVVNSAPEIPDTEFIFHRCCTLVDISGGLSRYKHSGELTYIGPGEVGRLNVSILLNRFVNA